MLKYYDVAEKNAYGETEIAWIVANKKVDVIKNRLSRVNTQLNTRENVYLQNSDIFSIGSVTFNAPYAYFLYNKALEFQHDIPKNLSQFGKLKYIYSYMCTHINYRWWLNERWKRKSKKNIWDHIIA